MTFNNVRNYSDKELINRVQQLKSFTRFPNGVLDIWVRSNEDAYNVFDDKVYTFDCSSGTPKFVMVCTGTTNAGAQGLKHFDRYNKLGCAVLKSDEIVLDSHIFGKHKNKYFAYVQHKGFWYYRDSNKNNKADEYGKLYNDVIGANCHSAGWYSTLINGWSVACLVRNQKEQFNEWMRFMNKRKFLSVSILREF